MLNNKTRQWNGRTLELLAPSGTFDIFRDMTETSCDAIYCGGRILNMRMIRKGYNFSNEELKEAVGLAEEKGKKIYITVNSLLDQSELGAAEDYLSYLGEIRPHGLIVQDLAVLDMVEKLKLDLPLHSSVMMNVHNSHMIRTLQQRGVNRFVLSREMTLEQVHSLSLQTDAELEYFTHGDMCAVHGSRCLYSSYVFGMSSNRGRCLKPCRWGMEGGEKPYPLAVKDLSLYARLSDMITAGISSFKIEGRMRSKEFIIPLIQKYGQALDRFLDNPLAFSRADERDMEPFRKRDFSTGYAFGIPGQDNINTRGEGSGKFYSTGKMFSTPTAESRIQGVKQPDSGIPGDVQDRQLTVKAGSVSQALVLLSGNPDRIYLSLEPFAPLSFPSFSELKTLGLACKERNCLLYLALPGMTGDRQSDVIKAFLRRISDLGLKALIEGLLISHIGMTVWEETEGYHLHADYTVNLYNSLAAGFLTQMGVSGWTASLELPFDSLLDMTSASRIKPEILIHGIPSVMYMDHDVSGKQADETVLDTGESRLRVRRDAWNRYHVLPETELTLLPRITELIRAGCSAFRLELQDYDNEEAAELMKGVNRIMKNPAEAEFIFSQIKPLRGGFSYGAQSFSRT